MFCPFLNTTLMDVYECLGEALSSRLDNRWGITIVRGEERGTPPITFPVGTLHTPSTDSTAVFLTAAFEKCAVWTRYIDNPKDPDPPGTRLRADVAADAAAILGG